MKFTDEKPPKNAKRIYRWADLPECLAPGKYLIEDSDGQSREIWCHKNRQRVLEGLIRSPLFSASYARLSDHVDHLKRAGVDIETLMFRNDPETGRKTYGIYRLVSNVTRVDTQNAEVAA
ncbi:hypothetical protein [Roseivivax sediminis]|uniref:Uncharacterized protein n=1 Tax=Roseivivax sediminis TaxID=936889 RepID=A0A1I1UH92_9RHOB|nr:hypothetical protein [Roseivivax sediminis]SFD67300.1 hypothetical protein SAMN04515678_102220 [Roseivivax sediminis]